MKHRDGGWSLVELMVVVGVLAIIASIAVPSYRSYMLRAQRSDATAALLALRSGQEKFFLQNGRYVTTTVGMTTAKPAGLGLGATSEHGNFNVTLAAGATPNTTYVATATATGGQTKDAPCQTFTINEAGVRSSGPVGITTCWK
jgi:type IV pilus assembly protein PilE